MGQVINNRFEPSHSLMKVLDLKQNYEITYEEYFDQKLMVDTLQDLSNSLMSTIKGLNSENYIK